MKLLTLRYIWVVIFFCLFGCGKKGAEAPAPANVQVVAGDTTATVTWDMVPGVQYFAFWAPVPSLTPGSCSSIPTCLATINVTTPFVISGLTDGTTYSVTVNGRTNGGPGGPGSPSIQVTPRLAGTTGLWTPGSTSSGNLNGVTNGYTSVTAGIYGGGQFVAVGTSGALYSSTDGINWSSRTNPLPTSNLNAVANYAGTYLSVGAGGTILYSPDFGITWTQKSSPSLNDLYAIYGYGGGIFVATGQSGTILTSDATGTIWTARASNTTNNLNGITFGNPLGTGYYVAVGDSGTLLTSTDAVTWTSNAISASVSSINLKSVAYGVVLATGVGEFVAVGTNGTVITSFDGINWTAQTPISATQLNAVTLGREFVTVDNAGNIFISTDGITWSLAQTASASLNALAHGAYDYSAVGAGGLTMHSM